MDDIKTVVAVMNIDCPSKLVPELRAMLGHHVDYLIDMEENKDLVKQVHGVRSFVAGDTRHEATKLSMLEEIVDDILQSRPETADPRKDRLYKAIQDVKTKLGESR